GGGNGGRQLKNPRNSKLRARKLALPFLRRRGVHLAGEENFFRRAIVQDKFTAEFTKRSRGEMRAHVGHQFQEQVRVVDADHTQTENLIHVQQVPQIRAREVAACEALATFLDRREVRLV